MNSVLIGMSTDEITQVCIQLGYPAYRGKQISEWIYRKYADNGSKMVNLPKEIRDWLTPEVIGFPIISTETESADGTTKCLLNLQDGESIECVLLPYKDRVSVCVSTQVGCPMGCVFCATGASGFSRNLTAGEIVGQYLSLSSISTARISHIVMMGMGEPLLNMDNLLKALSIFENEIGISARHVTISTIGIPKQIHMLAEHRLQSTLAISLHSPDQETRSELMPASKKYPIKELIESCKYYADKTHRRLTFEYLMIDGINDSLADAQALVKLLRGILCHVNLIPYNPVAGYAYKKSSRKALLKFRECLENGGIAVTQRLEKGASKDSACGQLKRSNNKPS